MSIFAPNATDAGHLEDYARKMYPHYNHLNVPTWIIGPALGEGPLIDRPADVLEDGTKTVRKRVAQTRMFSRNWCGEWCGGAAEDRLGKHGRFNYRSNQP